MKHFIVSMVVMSGISFMAIAQAPKKPATAKTPAKPAQAAKPVTPAATAVKFKSQLDSVAYGIGMNIGQNLKQQDLSALDLNILMQGMSDVIKGKTQFDDNQANMILGNYFAKQQASKQAEEAKKYESNKLAGQKFLEENKKKTGVVTLPSGLQYEVIKMGEGAKPTINDKVKTHYHGTLIDGTIFDSSVQRGEPIEFPVGGVIKGWTEALQLMPVGSKWKLYIPYDLAYGERSAGSTIKPYSTLVFEVELLDITK